MYKELIKIANELDERGLSKEASTLDQITKESLDGSGLLRHVENKRNNPSSKDSDPLLDISDIKKRVGEGLDEFGEYMLDTGEGLYDSTKAIYKDVSTAIGEGVDATSTAIGEGVDAASAVGRETYESIISSPDTVATVSIITKIVAAAAVAFPEPTTTGAGMAVLKSTAIADIIAATGYFKKGQNLKGFFSVLSAIVVVPAGPALKAFNYLKTLRAGNKIVLLSKHAPKTFIAALLVGIDGLIEIVDAVVENVNDEESILSTTISEHDPTGASSGGIKTSAEEVRAELYLIKDQLNQTDAPA
jgi:hypothetical protein